MSPPGVMAVVEQTGRWTYLIYIRNGMSIYGLNGHGWYRVGRRRAHAKAQRELRRYLANQRREVRP